MPPTGRGGFPSVNSNLAGAGQVNAIHFNAAKHDLGGKVAWLISAVLQLQATAVSAANSGVTFSAFSTAPSAISNFSAR